MWPAERVTTLEGLGADGKLDPVQQAFIACAAAQCGYCLNGMIMTARALIDVNPDPTDADIREALRFNLCRCGAHVEIVAAVRLAGDARPGMTPLQPQGLRRADYLEPSGTLAVVRPEAPGAPLDAAAADDLEPFVLVRASGEVTAFNGHVDLGTGIRTALAQIVAEELDVAFARVTMVLGDSAVAPDQGPTIASETIQLSAIPLRRAAAQARRFLVDRAAATFGIAAEALIVEDGVVRPLADDNRRLSYGELIGERAHPACAC